jgi:hypothetical protein
MHLGRLFLSVPCADADPSLSCVLRGAHDKDFSLPLKDI